MFFQSPCSILVFNIAGKLDFFGLFMHFDLVINNRWSFLRVKIANICFLHVLFP